MKNQLRPNAPLVFVFLGLRVPNYALSSIEIARQSSGVSIIVLADSSKPASVSSDVDWFVIADFYSPLDFRRFSEKSPFSADFRDGFWQKTAERFFVLRAFAAHSETYTFFHGELDCLFFELDRVESEVVQTGLTGIFLPRETSSRCIASLVYVNDYLTLINLCAFLEKHAAVGNEMEILGSLSHGGVSQFYALPTADFLFRGGEFAGEAGSWPVVPENPRFIVDGAVIGRWIFGVDPRNTGGRGTRNRIQNHRFGVPFGLPLASIETISGQKGFEAPKVSDTDGKMFKLATLHVHSKIHSKIDPTYLKRIFGRLERGKASWIVRPGIEFPLGVGRRVSKQAWAVIRSRKRLSLGFSQLISLEWWKGLPARLYKL